jgi:muramidase (phage lysozyme)
MLSEVGALADIEAGNFSAAIAKAGKRWSSLPCSQYGQTIRTFDQVKAWYIAAGGAFAS